MSKSPFNARRPITVSKKEKAAMFSLPELEKQGVGPISKLPVCIRVVLESLVRNMDGKRVEEAHVTQLANWKPVAERTAEIPFVVARVLLQDFTGVPLGVDLAAMRSAALKLSKDPEIIEPLVPVDLVIDHSVQVDYANVPDALKLNMELEFKRNASRYQFLKWCMESFESFNVVPPGIGICHQVNLEFLAKGVINNNGVLYPDTLVGTDSHTTMINGLGVVGWGVGGIEAEAAMLGQPVAFLTPDVVGFHMHNALREGVTATDLVLHVTQILRKHNVVGKFIEFFGAGAASLPVPDRATIGNMAPEYGATVGFFPVDEKTCEYFAATGRKPEQVELLRSYYKEQGMFGMPAKGQCDYTSVIELDLATVQPSVAGPKRPQDRIDLSALKQRFVELLTAPVDKSGYGKSAAELGKKFRAEAASAKTAAGGGQQAQESAPQGKGSTSRRTEVEMMNNRPTPDRVPMQSTHAGDELSHGSVVIAAITSCTNTSNPSVMIAAGLLAKKAAERGLKAAPAVKPSLAPGSRVVSGYLERSGLQKYLDEVGFRLVGYGCTTCIGNSGPLDPAIEETVQKNDLIVASVLSGNRNFEARVHQSVKANFLMSPPLVVALAIAGRVDIDFEKEPMGTGKDGKPVFLRDVWPTLDEISKLVGSAFDPELYRKLYADVAQGSEMWNEIPSPRGTIYEWDRESTYIQEPPYFDGFGLEPEAVRDIENARALAIFGDSVTTDHISPAGSIKKDSSAGAYLISKGVDYSDFNSYGARRGNHQVMVRGTFANVRIRNLMLPGTEGGVTAHQPSGEKLRIFEASERYQKDGVPLMVFAGKEYGTGSSRDWAAKGTRLLGVRAVVAESFERIHRSNLVGMGVLPCQFESGASAKSVGLTGTEKFTLHGLAKGLAPRQKLALVVTDDKGKSREIPVLVRIDTPIELEYYRHGGIMPFVLRKLIRGSTGA